MSDHLIAEANRHAKALTDERNNLVVELNLLREWQRETIQNERAHHAERKDAIARAERAEAELATERAHRNELSTLVKRLVREARRARPSDPLSFIAVDYLVRNKLHGEPMRTAMKEGAK